MIKCCTRSQDYKVLRAAKGKDWESIQRKYADNSELTLVVEYPEMSEIKQKLSLQEKRNDKTSVDHKA